MDQNSLVFRFFKAIWNLLKRLGGIIAAFFTGFSSKMDIKKKSAPKKDDTASESTAEKTEEKEE
jgi:hypothetical protein